MIEHLSPVAAKNSRPLARRSPKAAHRSASRLWILDFALWISTLLAAPLAAQDAAVRVERDMPATMRDGVVLRADVYRPTEGGPWPVLVERTPYGKHGLHPEALVRAGYIVVCQDA